MDATPLRPRVPSRFRRATALREPDALAANISALVSERQLLRTEGASAARLERNRLRIARAQWELSHALIERYLPQPAADAA